MAYVANRASLTSASSQLHIGNALDSFCSKPYFVDIVRIRDYKAHPEKRPNATARPAPSQHAQISRFFFLLICGVIPGGVTVKDFAKLSRRVAVYLFLTMTAALFVPRHVRGQDLGSLQGTVSDPSGAAIVGARITATDLASSVSHVATTGKDGGYNLTQLSPGDYKVEIAKDGFKRYVQPRVTILVATPTLLDARLQLGSFAQQVVVESAAAPTINTEDATVGNAFNEEQVTDLPILAGNVVNLLTIQPGVVFTGMSDTDRLNMGDISTLDGREGVVDGIRGNQSDVTVDGVDSNDWQNQSPFTSAVPVTLDSVEEFRVTTTNANATNGLTGGAQVQMITKSGSNSFHGDAYWYYRTTGAAANAWFNKDVEPPAIQRPKLQRNLGGGSLGGPIKKDRLFFFATNEERRDATAAAENRDVPTDTLRDGVLAYQCSSASQCPGVSVMGQSGKSYTFGPGFSALDAAAIKSLDPAGLGINPAMLPYFSLYPHGNDPTEGLDTGLNFIGFRFNAPELTSRNVYIAKMDYKITADGRHTISWRGSLQGLRTDLVGAQLPGESAAQQLLNNSRGLAVQYQGQLSANVVDTARYGFTRQGIAESGTQGPQFDVRSFDDLLNFATRLGSRIVPVHEVNDDLSWNRGSHTIQMGGVLRIVTNDRIDESSSFPAFDVNNGFCVSLCDDVTNEMSGVAGAPPPGINPTAITRAFMGLTGSITQVNATFFGDPATGAIQPTGTPDARSFAERSFEVYGQDSWRIRSNLTLTYGLRYGYETPVWETNGFEVSPSINIMSWFKQRVANMNAGIPSSASPLLSWVPAGKANRESSWYQPDFKDFGPRLAIAYSPDFDNGLGSFLFGGPGKTSIRLGSGIFYDNIGQPIAVDSDLNGSPGTATALFDGSQQFTFASAPRFAGTCSLTAGCTGLPAAAQPFFSPPTQATFPFTPPANVSALGFAVDPGLRTPYSMHFDADIQRELPHHFVLDVGYVGTLGRRLLGKIDFAQYLDIRDPQSGEDLWSAYRQIAKIANVTPASIQTNQYAAISPGDLAGLATIKDIPFFNNMTPNMPAFAAAFFGSNSYASLTPTQAFYAYSVADAGSSGGSWSCALFPMDTIAIPSSFSFGFPSPWNTKVDPNGTGLVLFQQQFQSMPGWTNWASSNYHSLQVSVRKSAGMATFAANYVFSKGIDNASGAENGDFVGGTLNALIQNPFDHRLGRALSDFNLRHNFNGDVLLDMPFGRGRRYFSSANRLLDGVVGGWQLSGIVRWHSGFPESPSNGFNFPTNFFLTTPGTEIAPISTDLVRHGMFSQGSINAPNLFTNQNALTCCFSFTPPGLPGSRNVLTGPAYAATDLGVSKAFRIAEAMTLRLQARAFNVFNSVNFDDGTLSLDPTSPSTFGNLTGTAGPRGGAREMEFGARFDF
jgi:hypothetical protein